MLAVVDRVEPISRHEGPRDERCPSVHVVLAPFPEQERGAAVDHDTNRRDPNDRRSVRHRWGLKPTDRFPGDRSPCRQQNDCVGQRR